MPDSGIVPTELVTVSGPVLIGYLLNCCLYGVLSLQVYLYYLAFPEDRVHNKVLVYAVYLLETLQSILVMRDAFVTFSSGFGDPNAIIGMHYAWLTMPVIGSIVACIVQTLYAYRIWVLSDHSKIVPIIIIVMAFTQCVGALIDGVLAYRAGAITRLNGLGTVIGHIMWDATCAVCDVVIAICMSYYLSKFEAGFAATQALLSRILQLTVGTGVVTATVAIIDLALFFGASNRGGFFMSPCAVIGKLYSNSMMVMFNSRLQIVGGRNDVEKSHFTIRSILFRSVAAPAQQQTTHSGIGAVGPGSGETSTVVSVHFTSGDVDARVGDEKDAKKFTNMLQI